MKKYTALAFAILASCSYEAFATPITSNADSALMGATVIDFNSEAIGTFSSRTINGVTFSGVGVNLTISNDSNGQYVPAQDTFLDNRSGGGSFNFLFGSSVSAFGLQIGATNSVQTLTAYDSLNNVLETLVIPNQVGTQPHPYTGFYGMAHAGISRVTLSANAGDWIVLDDFTFTGKGGSSVAEPGSIAMLMLGLFGLGFARRARR